MLILIGKEGRPGRKERAKGRRRDGGTEGGMDRGRDGQREG